MKLTPWFPNSIKPVRRGVYEIRGSWLEAKGRQCFRYWNGFRWGLSMLHYRDACDKPTWNHGEDMTGWRGIKK